jgi:hypothetical protein
MNRDSTRCAPPQPIAADKPRLTALAEHLLKEVGSAHAIAGNFESAVNRLCGAVPTAESCGKVEAAPDCVETRLIAALTGLEVLNERLRSILRRFEGAV